MASTPKKSRAAILVDYNRPVEIRELAILDPEPGGIIAQNVPPSEGLHGRGSVPGDRSRLGSHPFLLRSLVRDKEHQFVAVRRPITFETEEIRQR